MIAAYLRVDAVFAKPGEIMQAIHDNHMMFFFHSQAELEVYLDGLEGSGVRRTSDANKPLGSHPNTQQGASEEK